jgi:hypothetical protein
MLSARQQMALSRGLRAAPFENGNQACGSTAMKILKFLFWSLWSEARRFNHLELKIATKWLFGTIEVVSKTFPYLIKDGPVKS